MIVRTLRSLAALAFTLVFSGLAVAQDRPALIGAVRGSEVVNANPAAPLARTRLVSPDFSALSHVGGFLQTRPGVVRPMDIAFFDDRSITVTLNRVERLENGIQNYYGGVEGDEFGHAVITSSNDVMAATVFTGGKTYSLRARPEGYVSREVNTTALSEHPFDMVRPDAGATMQADAGPPVALDTAAFIDVIVLYTTKTRIAAGGVAAVEVEVNNGIAVSNSAYANTGVTQRVRLAYTGEINYTGDTATVNLQTVLFALQPNSTAAPTGVFAGIPALRNTYGGDILSLWIEGDGPNGGTGNGGCGIGYFMDPAGASFAQHAVNVLVRELCAVDNQSFPHEMGHNMGLAHDAFASPTGSASKPYARGYVDVGHGFRTIMAYNSACEPAFCTRINGFSSPLFTNGGFVIGVNNVADSSRAMNENALIVANFKTSVVGPGTLQVKASTLTVAEGVGTANVLVSRTGGSLGAVSVAYGTANGTGIAGTDYSTAVGVLNWADGDTADKMIPVPVTQNAIVDGNRTFTATISAPGGGAALGAATTTVTITDDEAALSFALATSNVSEGASTNVNVAVARVGSTTGAVGVTWTTSDGTALAGTDFGANGNTTQRTGTLNWSTGDGTVKNITLGLAASNVPIINDGAVEVAKTFTITLSSPTGGAAVGANPTNTVTIVDPNSSIQFDGTAIAVSEAGPNMSINVTRTGATNAVQAVTYTTSAGTATATTDYTTTTGTLTFGVGETTKVITVGPTVVGAPFVRIMNDTTIEGPETFNITLSNATNASTLGINKVMVVTINSDENGVSMATASRGFTEGNGAQTIIANRSGAGSGALDVNYAFTNGTATNGSHYSGVNGSLHWDAGDLTPKAIPVTINDDGAPNTARTFTVTLSGATAGTTIAAPTATTVTIADNDNSVQFSAATATVAEGTANLVLTVTRTGVTTQDAHVNWTANNGTATSGVDFGGPTSGTLDWAAGVNTSKTITIPILNDVLVENPKTFTVSLSSPSGPNVSAGTNSTITVTLNDNDKGLSFEFPTYSVDEGPGSKSAVIRVVRIGPATTAATAMWATVNGSAESGKDFGVLNSLGPRTGSLSWAINDAAAKTITIPIINDNLGGEGDQTFTVVLTPGAGMVLGAYGIATVTIHDDDIPPETNVQFSQPKYVVMENGVSAVLTVTRTNIGAPSALGSSVQYATVPGTALATSDYTTKTGTLTWPPGDFAPKDITIAIVNNTTPEPPESFKVTLSTTNPGTGLGTPNEAGVLIVDDDEAFPLDGAMPAGFATPAGATKGWHVSNDPGAYEGVFALKSDEIDDNETAGLDMDGTFAAGSVSFRVKVSTELTFDTLQFYIDGVLKATWSGTASTAWQMSSSYPVTAGHHTLSWVYTKDGSASVGLDAVYLDGLVTPTFTP